MQFPTPWLERNGKFSGFRSVVLAALFIPLIMAVYGLFHGAGVARPAIEFNHRVGLWGYYLLLISLAITPARQILKWPRLVVVRRMIGVAAFMYIVLHVLAYAVDKGFDMILIVTELVRRFYLTIGLAALILLAALAATSTDGMVRRLGGKKWQGLHRGAYAAALLGTIHFFLQMKLNVTLPTIYFGLLLWLMSYRVIFWKWRVETATHPLTLALLALVAGLATGLGEAAYYNLFYHTDPVRMLNADLSFRRGPRPVWIVLFTGVAAALLGFTRRYVFPPVRQR